LLQAEQSVADSHVEQSVMFAKQSVVCKILLLLLVEFDVELDEVFVYGGGYYSVPLNTFPLPGQAFVPAGQRVLLHGIPVAIAKAPQVDCTSFGVKDSL
jgi:hypothetical protein